MTSSGTGAGWWLLLFLTALNILNFVDRQLIASLAPLLMSDLGLTRAQIGLLAGFGFVVLYTLAGLFVGAAADRWPRLKLIAGGLTLWSAMTAVSGAARGFAGLAAPRLLVGIGEATLTPAALSMLGDTFPARRLGLATGIYYTGIPLGTAVSFIVAGWIAPRFGWRLCFHALGLAGLAAVAVLFLFREPTRRRDEAVPPTNSTGAGPAARPGLRQLRDAMVARPSLWLVMLGGALLAYGSASAILVLTWLVQERGFPYATAAYLAGSIAIAAGLTGNLAGGWFADLCGRRRSGGRPWSLVIITLFFAPLNLAFFLLPPTSPLFYVCWFFASASATTYFGPVFSAVQELAPVALRSTTVACALVVVNLGGVGPGAWLTGVIGDHRSLTAGLVLSVFVAALSIVPFALAARFEARRAPAEG